MTIDTSDNVRALVAVAQQAAAPVALEPGKYHVVHTGDRIHTVDLTTPEATGVPARKSGTTTVRDAASFAAYYGKHADPNTEVYADADRLTVTAVLDAHTTTSPRWSGHRLTLSLRKTKAWEQWITNDGKLMGQELFAEFLEDHLPELRSPDAATMLEIAQSFQATSKVDFTAGTRLATGQRQFSYVENTQARAGQKGQLVIPEVFTIGLVPFEGSGGYELTARLRYRIQESQLRIGYKLERPDDTVADAFADVVEKIREQIEQPIMNGTPA
ncbi:DUF2303 family protein [Streptomyces sp. NPDC056169]|uniref:DUF2303 family protein n=1 Tax=Streptomyces sp. NPDC056169 TaxID=3345734 RepID=UPI0035D5A0C6